MEAKLRKKTTLGVYVVATYDGVNYSGVEVLGDRILVEPDRAAAYVNGLHVIPEKQEQVTMAAETGVIIGLGGEAFKYNSDRSRLWGDSRKPVVGDRIVFDRYAGSLVLGEDKRIYRIMDDKCVGGLTGDAPPRPPEQEDDEVDIGVLAAAAMRPIEVPEVGESMPIPYRAPSDYGHAPLSVDDVSDIVGGPAVWFAE